MATNSLGQDRELLAASVSTELKRAFGRLAFLSDTSMAAMLREMVVKAVEQAKKDGRILGALALLLLVAPQVFKAPGGDDDLVRNVRRVRGRRKDGLDTLDDGDTLFYIGGEV